MDRIEEYMQELIHAIDFPDIRDAANRLWLDIARYGPGMIPNVPITIPRFPGLGDFEIPPPPVVPPPPPPTWYEQAWDWTHRHPWKTSTIAAGVIGASFLVGYGTVQLKAAHKPNRRVSKSGERRQVVVVLGADIPHGPPLVSDLEQKGYIVIASVATQGAADALERMSSGYVKALVFDPNQPDAVPTFLRSLSSCLSRRFPLNSAGDPFAPLSSAPYIRSVISLLPLSPPPTNAPLEHISLRESFLPYLSSSAIVPLQIIQALLPLLRNNLAHGHRSQKSIIFCVPAILARVGLPFESVQAMACASTLRAAEVLRREVQAASLTDKMDSTKHIRVVVVDVGSFDVDSHSSLLETPQDVYKAMEAWTPSEKLTYGPSFASISYTNASGSIHDSDSSFGVPRKPTDISVFVNSLAGVVKCDFGGPLLFGYDLGVGKFRNWLAGDRFAIGAGAGTYQWASHLPTFVLDTLLSIPHHMVSFRNYLIGAKTIRHTKKEGPVRHQPTIVPDAPVIKSSLSPATDSLPSSGHDSGNEASSEAEVESNPGVSDEGSNVADSWVSLHERHE